MTVLSMWRKRIGSISVVVLLALVLWGYVVGPLVATFQESLTGPGGGLSQYLTFFNFRSGAQGESMLGSIVISFLSVVTSGVTGVFLAIRFWFWSRSPFRL
jgi:iron(III) transport system permease protein